MSQYSVLYALSPAEVEAYAWRPPDQWFGNELFERRGGHDLYFNPRGARPTEDEVEWTLRSLTLGGAFDLLHFAIDPTGYTAWWDATVEGRADAARGRLGRAVRGVEVFEPAAAFDDTGHETRWVEPADVQAVAAELVAITPDVARSNLRGHTDPDLAEPWRSWTVWHDRLLERLARFYRERAVAGDAVVVTWSV